MDPTTKQLLSLGQEHYDKGEFDRAEKVLLKVVREHPTYADVQNMLGVIYHGQTRFSQAKDCFERALQLNPEYTEAALNLAVTLNELGLYHEAKQIYGQAIVRTRTQPRALDSFAVGKLANMHADIATAYERLGLFSDAAREYRQGLQLCPGFADLRTRLAHLYRESGQQEEAAEQYQQAVTRSPNYLPARLHLGVTLFALGRKAEARAQWEAVLELDSTNRNAQFYLKTLDSDVD